VFPTSRNGFPELLESLGLHGRGIEIGVRYGTFSKWMLEHWQCDDWWMVDAWKPLPDDIDATQCTEEECEDWYKRAEAVAKRFPGIARMYCDLSEEAAKRFPDHHFDFIHLDAGHTDTAISSDVELWYPKVAPGGIFSGHDYFNGHVKTKRPVHEEITDPNHLPLFAVKYVVDQFAASPGKPVHSTTDDIFNSWWIQC
jgi:hypothetical protein